MLIDQFYDSVPPPRALTRTNEVNRKINLNKLRRSHDDKTQNNTDSKIFDIELDFMTISPPLIINSKVGSLTELDNSFDTTTIHAQGYKEKVKPDDLKSLEENMKFFNSLTDDTEYTRVENVHKKRNRRNKNPKAVKKQRDLDGINGKDICIIPNKNVSLCDNVAEVNENELNPNDLNLTNALDIPDANRLEVSNCDSDLDMHQTEEPFSKVMKEGERNNVITKKILTRRLL